MKTVLKLRSFNYRLTSVPPPPVRVIHWAHRVSSKTSASSVCVAFFTHTTHTAHKAISICDFFVVGGGGHLTRVRYWGTGQGGGGGAGHSVHYLYCRDKQIHVKICLKDNKKNSQGTVFGLSPTDRLRRPAVQCKYNIFKNHHKPKNLYYGQH